MIFNEENEFEMYLPKHKFRKGICTRIFNRFYVEYVQLRSFYMKIPYDNAFLLVLHRCYGSKYNFYVLITT